MFGVMIGFSGEGGGTLSFQEKDSFSPESKTGIVLVVYDGDTVMVRFNDGSQERIRLIGIDCCEMNDPDPEQALKAFISKRMTFISLYQKKVMLTFDWESRDKYGRLLAYIWTEDIGLFNQYLIEKGLAVVFRKYPFKYREIFLKKEKNSQKQNLGFWRDDPYPVIPASEAEDHAGGLVSIRFRCDRIRENRRYLILEPLLFGFSVVIPQRKRDAFPVGVFSKGTVMMVTGLLEKYKGKLQIMAEIPSQIRIQKEGECSGVFSLLYAGCLGIIPP